MEKLRYNVERHKDYISIGIKPPFDIQADCWFNLKVNLSQVKDKRTMWEKFIGFFK